jgi:hypothetical protein
MMRFANRIEALAAATQQRRRSKAIKADQRFIVCLTDKNLGPAILERNIYIYAMHTKTISAMQTRTEP